jgi:hypothetical protein
MPIKDVVSPVTRKGSKVGSVSGTPLSPGARSAPGRADRTMAHSVPEQPKHGTSTHQEPQPQESPSVQQHRASTHQEPPVPVGATPVVVGPEE